MNARRTLGAGERLPVVRSQFFRSRSIEHSDVQTAEQDQGQRRTLGDVASTNYHRLGQASWPTADGDVRVAQEGRCDSSRTYSPSRLNGVRRSLSGRNGGLPQRRKSAKQRALQSSLGYTYGECGRFSAPRHENAAAEASGRDASAVTAYRRRSRRYPKHAKQAWCACGARQNLWRDSDVNYEDTCGRSTGNTQ